MVGVRSWTDWFTAEAQNCASTDWTSAYLRLWGKGGIATTKTVQDDVSAGSRAIIQIKLEN